MFAITDVQQPKDNVLGRVQYEACRMCRDLLADKIQRYGKPEFNIDQGSQFTSELFVK